MNKKTMERAVGAAALVLVAGCVTVELPNVVSDTAKAGKDVYQAYKASKVKPSALAASAPAAPAARFVQNTYVGKDTQTVAEIKRLCVEEAGAKWSALVGRAVAYDVTENSVQTIEDTTVANCRLTMAPG